VVSKYDRKILHTRKRRKANGIGHIWHRNCLLKRVIKGKIEKRIELTGRRRIRGKQLLDDLTKVEDTGNWKRKQ
jgi:hypothetical protein